jgi:hypothetical protein
VRAAKRSLLLALIALTLPCAGAQSSYVGLHLSGIASSSGVTPFGALQVGGPVADGLELRLSGLPLVLANAVQLDLLYTQRLTETVRVYAGGGGSFFSVVRFEISPGGRDGRAFSVHGTAGLETDVGSGIGLFAEVQPTYVLNAPDEDVEVLFCNEGAATFFGTLALGVRIHF